MRKIFNILGIAVLTVAGLGRAVGRETYSLNDGWRFFFRYENTSDAARPVTVPHTWNLDALNGVPLYRQTTADYVRDLYIPAEWRGKRIFLRFHGVQSVADVFINAEHTGEHRGGFTAFTMEITDFLRYDYNNSLHVMVSNTPENDIFPLSTEMNLYGGIYRDVELIVTDRTIVAPDYYGTDGVLVNQSSVSRETVEGSVTVHLSSPEAQTCNVQLLIKGPDGYSVVSKSHRAKLDGKPVTIPFSIQNPSLWSPYEPNLYTVEVVAATDTVRVVTGFRSVDVEAGGKLRLNGRTTPVRGVTLWHDNKRCASALSESDFASDLDLVCDMGANAVRSATGPHSRDLYELCDRRGVLVWVDFPLTQAPFPSDVAYIPSERLRENGRRQAREIIVQNYNHPSVIMWGIFSQMHARNNDIMDYLREINDTAHRLDSSRPTVACSNRDGEINFITDLIVWQQDFGWEKGNVSDLAIWQSMLAKSWGHLRSAVIYGPHSASGQPESDSAAKVRERNNYPFDIRRRIFHEGYVEELNENSVFWGVWLNEMFDYGSSRYLTGIHDGGTVTIDRSHRNDIYYLYRSVWNTSSPTVHINAGRVTDPAAEERTIELYSSVENPVLLINGDTVALERTGLTRYESAPLKLKGVYEAEVRAGGVSDKGVFTTGNFSRGRQLTALPRKEDQ